MTLPGMTDRARGLRRLATALLVLMAGLFLLSRQMLPQHAGGWSGWGWLRAFSEAAMVGGLADWFAVTALFRHPLGLPVPHTAIIPANKNRIADAMAGFLQSNFLTAAVVARRLRGMNLAAAMGNLLSDPTRDGALRLRQGTASLLGDVMESLAGERLGTMAKSALRGQLDRLDLAPLLGQLMSAAMAEGRHLPVIEAALRWAGVTLEANEDLLRAMIHERANALLRWTGLDERLANGIVDGLYKLLAECAVAPAHPMRRKLEEGLERLADDLMHDPVMRARVAGMKRELLANPAMAAWMDGLWRRARLMLLRTASQPERLLSGRFGQGLAGLGEALRTDPGLQKMINRVCRRVLAGLAARHGGSIVKLVSETVRRWDARTVTYRLETVVGRDLQYIRINGTLVGGLVGLLLHALDVLL